MLQWCENRRDDVGLVSTAEDKDKSERKRQNKDMRETLKMKWIVLVPLQTVFHYHLHFWQVWWGRPDSAVCFLLNKITFVCVMCAVGEATPIFLATPLARLRAILYEGCYSNGTLSQGKSHASPVCLFLFALFCTENLLSLSLKLN